MSTVTKVELRELLQNGEVTTPFSAYGQIRRFFDLDSSPPRYRVGADCYTTTMDDGESRGYVDLTEDISSKLIGDLLDSGTAEILLTDCTVHWEGRERFFESASWRDYADNIQKEEA